MKQLTAIMIGAGARGSAYAQYALDYPHELKFVAVAEANPERLAKFAGRHGIAEERCYTSWEQLLAAGPLADIAVIATQDRMHTEPTVRALRQSYHVLLEKPMSPEPQECVQMELAAKENDRLLTICHVLRYTPFWSAIKRLLSEGRIGEVASIQLNENVGYWHMAHSFVRGNWSNSDQSSPMILAKSCHDMDVLSWLMDQPCRRISSFGSLMHFHEGNAPAGSGDRCLSCEVEPTCPYSAPRFYLGEGMSWARHFTEGLTRDSIVQGLQETNYGRCVYRSDNNVVDHQVVNMEFASGATAMFSMCGFTRDQERRIQIMGTRGELRGEGSRITVMDFLTHEHTVIDIPEQASGHGGGDSGIVRSFLREVRAYGSGAESLTSASASVRSHLMAFAAERSRLAHGQSIDLDEYYRELTGR
ncbi:Oxidoreductase family, C-terminal alpha/beta domain [Paenibacillus sp. UNCCL117]|uniref:Gfo/Idh/MocA family protein n=1 Tax=unclassified Paenibacillus TaxID=185978 RepID=UPI00088317E5|nr:MULTISPECIES: Gfo/Idh/MocA family oxidoreductase [unclassified Paenibacillus]SDD76420.1 Oxidoreductase family, C-terminal alpha/beta domain [Paenibacillus sp. cl123]SFW52433.1 Oxidoreductase family, C-terminal alpha/beta domain [Paenibacillus sp. UNCCL117]